MGGNRQTCFQASFLSLGRPFRASEIPCAAEHVIAMRIHVYGGKSADLAVPLIAILGQIFPVPFAHLSPHCEDDFDGVPVLLVMPRIDSYWEDLQVLECFVNR